MLVFSRVALNATQGKIRRYALAALTLIALFVFIIALPVYAQDRFGVEYGAGSGLSTQDVRTTIANIIRYALGVIGAIFLVLIIYGGVTWMTAGGQEQKVEKAKKIITNATIGLIIIFLAFAIVSFVIGKLEEATGGGGGGGGGDPCPNPPCLPGGSGSGFNVSSVYPPDLQLNVKLCAVVQGIFNADIAPATINSTSVTVHPLGSVNINGSYAVNANNFAFSHPEFLPGTPYEATITTDVRNLVGDYLERPRVWNFTTGTESDDILPRVEGVYPLDGATDICLAAPIQVIFSEEMNVTTLNASNVILEKQLPDGTWMSTAVGSVAAGTDFSSMSVYPVGNFEPNTQYRVTLLTGITDSCGNPLDGNRNGIADGAGDTYDSSVSGPWTFTTGTTSECTPFISSVTPSAAYYSDEIVTIVGDYFFIGAGSDTYFNNLPADQNCFNAQFVPNTLCRVSWSNNEIQVRVPAGSTSGPLWVDVGGKRSNSVNFQVRSPYLGALSPGSGPVGSFVTLSGLQFGTVRGRVMIGDVEAEFPCADNWYDGSVVIRIPAGLSPGNYPVQLFTAPPASRASNRLSFTVTTGPLGPGLCSLAPQCGNAGTAAALTGEQFGETQGASTVTFGTLAVALTSPWSDTALSVQAPAFPGDGNYPVAVTVQGLKSNEIAFTTPCAPGGGSCGNSTIDAGEQCDGTVPPPPLTCAPPALGIWQCNAGCQLFGCDGGGSVCGNNLAEGSEQCDGSDLHGLSCESYGGNFVDGTLGCDVGCGFDTSSCITPADEPRIIEDASCNINPQSPSPFRDTIDACRNALVSVTFDRDMNESTFGDITVRQCPGNPSIVDCGSETALRGLASAFAVSGGREAYLFEPDNYFIPSAWHEVTVPVSVTSAQGVSMSAQYTWSFQVRSGEASCTATQVSVAPSSATITTLGGTQGFTALAAGSNCNILAGTYSYTWSSSDVARATVSGSRSNTETATAIAETDSGAPVDITARIPTGNVEGAARLSIVLDPLICVTNDDCNACGVGASQCVDGQCTPVVTDVQPSPSPVGSWVTIAGCYFGNNQGTIIYGGGTEGLWPDPAICGPSMWTNNQIISEIPNVMTAIVTDDAVSGPVIVRRPDGQEDASPVSLTVDDAPRPDLCRIIPTSGQVSSAFTVQGQGFGSSRGVANNDNVFFGTTAVTTYANWSDNTVAATVPGSLAAGATEVTLSNDNAVSNPLSYTVTGGGINTACDADNIASQCQANDTLCNAGLFCDLACTCQLAPAPSVVAVFPADGSANVCRNTAVTVEFSQLMDHGSINSESIALLQGNCSRAIRAPQEIGLWQETFFAWWSAVRERILSWWRAAPTQAQESLNCPSYDIAVTDLDVDGDGIWENTIDHTLATLTMRESLDPNMGYRLIIGNPARSRYGVPLASEETFGFTTGEVICSIDRVSIWAIKGPLPATADETNIDIFLCAGRDDCGEDAVAGTPGNQHTWIAEAYDAQNNPLSAEYHWTPYDPQELFTLSGTEVSRVDATPDVRKGAASFEVGAHGEGMGAATTTIAAVIELCENPWPNPPPLTDTDYDFSLWYCRDAGVPGPEGDLPALTDPPVTKDRSPDTRILREYLFLRDVTRDAIGLRIYKNPDNLSVQEWYQRNASQPGSPGGTEIDGLPALTDGRSLYVLAPNLAANGQFYINVFLLSYNEGADADTQQIFNGLKTHLVFMLGIKEADKPAITRDLKRVTDLGAIRAMLIAYGESHRICQGSQTPCTLDADGGSACPASTACEIHYPSLTTGSYIPFFTTSRWPSWQSALGNILGRALPIDPSNSFPHACDGGTRAELACTSDGECEGGACIIPLCPAPGFDQVSCWNTSQNRFFCPDGSLLYAYQSNNATVFNLGANLEYLAGSSGSVGGCSMNYRVGL